MLEDQPREDCHRENGLLDAATDKYASNVSPLSNSADDLGQLHGADRGITSGSCEYLSSPW